MSRVAGRTLFLVLVGLFATVVVLGVREVPQPLRGYLVGWLLFAGSLGAFVLRFLRHYFRYKTEQLRLRPRGARTEPAQRRRPSRRQVPPIEVVFSKSGGMGRHTIR